MITIYGTQFLSIGVGSNYTVTGIPSGYTLVSIVMPNGWSVNTTGIISGGSQIFNVTTGIGSGTMIITYTDGTYPQTAYLDVYIGSMKRGEELTQTGGMILSSPTPPVVVPCGTENLCPQQETDCPFVLDVFADVNNPTIDLNNDKSDFYYWGNTGTSSITLTLQKNADDCGGCTWNDVLNFVTGGSGYTFYPFGLAPNGVAYMDDFGNSYTGLLLPWITILNTYGTGNYRMKIVYGGSFGGGNTTLYDDRIFCLHQYDCFKIDGTVRIETINSGFRGTMKDNTMQVDYGKAWYGQIRLKGIFYETKPSYNKEFNQYGYADFNAFKPVVHELIPKFLMDIRPVPGWIDWMLSNYILLADAINVTDYNASNRKQFVKTPVINDGGIDTKDDVFMNPLAWSQISLSYGQNNLRKRND